MSEKRECLAALDLDLERQTDAVMTVQALPHSQIAHRHLLQETLIVGPAGVLIVFAVVAYTALKSEEK